VTRFRQQNLKAWQPILTPKPVIISFFVLGLIFLPLGIGLLITSNNVKNNKSSKIKSKIIINRIQIIINLIFFLPT